MADAIVLKPVAWLSTDRPSRLRGVFAPGIPPLANQLGSIRPVQARVRRRTRCGHQQLGSRIATALHEGRIDIEQPAILGVDQGQLVKASFKRIEITVVTALAAPAAVFR
jgi:hypothetical protein